MPDLKKMIKKTQKEAPKAKVEEAPKEKVDDKAKATEKVVNEKKEV